MPDTEPGKRVTGAGLHAKHLPFGPEVGANAGKPARTDLRGVRPVMGVPTATPRTSSPMSDRVGRHLASRSDNHRAGLAPAENKCARILAAVLFQISQYALIGQVQSSANSSSRGAIPGRGVSIRGCDLVSIASSRLESKLPGLRLIDPTIACFPSAITILPCKLQVLNK